MDGDRDDIPLEFDLDLSILLEEEPLLNMGSNKLVAEL
jgi:hypothetical protein